jgi:hypothetical protein
MRRARYRFGMRPIPILAAVAALAACGCSYHHEARIVSADLPPPRTEMVKHTGRLLIEPSQTSDRQCLKRPGELPLCFAGVRTAIGTSLERTLWPSFPDVHVKQKSDDVGPGDFLLLVDLRVEAVDADASGPGWSAAVHGSWQLVRDGIPMAREDVSSRSAAEYPYGHSLGIAAGEVLDAVALHIASTVGQLPETRPSPSVPLPSVVATNQVGPLFAGLKHDQPLAQH